MQCAQLIEEFSKRFDNAIRAQNEQNNRIWLHIAKVDEEIKNVSKERERKENECRRTV